jgi:hypothetical protein
MVVWPNWRLRPMKILRRVVAPACESFCYSRFWFSYRQLPDEIQSLADKNFELLKQSPRHPSLWLKKIGVIYTARVGLHYRAIAKDRPRRLSLVLDRTPLGLR